MIDPSYAPDTPYAGFVMTLLLIYGISAIAISFLCSLLEACLLSIPAGYVEVLVNRGSKAAARLKKMKHDIDRPLGAILTLNTIAHTAGATGVGAQSAVVFGSTAVGIASAVMTLLVLVVSEIIPKTLGAVHAKALALPASVMIRVMIWICLPILIPLEWINRLLRSPTHMSSLSREELLAVVRMGHADGEVSQRELKIVSNLIGLVQVRLEDVMTPRTVLFTLPESTTVGEAFAHHRPFRFSRIPLRRESVDEIRTYVSRFAIDEARVAGENDRALVELATPIAVFPETASVGDSLSRMIEMKQHIALVVDEHGGTAGVVSLEDLVETLLGDEIVDEADPIDDMRKLAVRRRRRQTMHAAPATTKKATPPNAKPTAQPATKPAAAPQPGSKRQP